MRFTLGYLLNRVQQQGTLTKYIDFRDRCHKCGGFSTHTIETFNLTIIECDDCNGAMLVFFANKVNQIIQGIIHPEYKKAYQL